MLLVFLVFPENCIDFHHTRSSKIIIRSKKNTLIIVLTFLISVDCLVIQIVQ